MKGKFLMTITIGSVFNSSLSWALIGIFVLIILIVTLFSLFASPKQNKNLEKLIKAFRS